MCTRWRKREAKKRGSQRRRLCKKLISRGTRARLGVQRECESVCVCVREREIEREKERKEKKWSK